MRKSGMKLLVASLMVQVVAQALPDNAKAFTFTPGDIVVDTVTNSVSSSTPLDTASPITLEQFSLGSNGTSVSAAGTRSRSKLPLAQILRFPENMALPPRGILQQSANGQYLTMMGYGVNAGTFNNAPLSTYGTAALSVKPRV